MRIRWTPAAADDLESIANYLLEKTPENAASLDPRDLFSAILTRSFSRLWPRRQEGRERVVSGLPYIIVYQVKVETLDILRVLHSSQDWPK